MNRQGASLEYGKRKRVAGRRAWVRRALTSRLGMQRYAGTAAPAHHVIRDIRSTLASIKRYGQALPKELDPIRYVATDVPESLKAVFADPEGNYGKPAKDTSATS